MMQYIKIYFITLIIFFIIDIIWLGFIASGIYKQYLGYIMKTDVNFIAALLFYMLFIVGIIFFVINPAIEKDSLSYAIFAGAFFGLITYATYDMTNLATIKDWPLFITVIDLIWGTVLCSLTASLSFYLIKLLGVI